MGRNKKVLRLLVCIGMVFILTGCSTINKFGADGKADAAKTTVTWWYFPVFSAADNGKSYEEELVKAFEKEHPDILVKLEKLDYKTGPDKIQVALENGVCCDVLLDAPGRIISYGKAGNLVSLEDMFTEDYLADADNDAIIGACKAGDIPYMYPLSSAPFYMAFNKAMLEEAGVLDLVKEGFTTQDFTTVVEALRKCDYVSGSVFCNGQGGDQGTRAFVANLYSSSVINDSLSRYTLNDEGSVKALAYVQRAVQEGKLVNGSRYTGTEAIENFVNKKAAFTLLWGPSQQNSYQETLDRNEIETVEVPYPSEDGVPELEYLVNGFCIFDNQEEAKIEASKELIKFICDNETWGPKSVQKTGCIPVRTSFGELYTDDRMQMISGWAKYYGTYYNTVDGFSDMRVAWYQMLNSLLIDNEAPAALADQFVMRANQALQENGGQQ